AKACIFVLKVMMPLLQRLVLLEKCLGQLRPLREGPKELVPLLAEIRPGRVTATRLPLFAHRTPLFTRRATATSRAYIRRGKRTRAQAIHGTSRLRVRLATVR